LRLGAYGVSGQGSSPEVVLGTAAGPGWSVYLPRFFPWCGSEEDIKIDDEVIGETAAKTYFYRLVSPGPHVLATESEFGDNLLELNAQAGKNHYVRQSIKMGVFVGGAKLTEVSESEGQKGVRNTKLAR